MKEKNLREALEKCSKAELIEIIVKAADLRYTAFSWLDLVSEIKLNKIGELLMQI